MDTATALTPSKKRKRARSILKDHRLPPEMIEEILLNLPLKSLLRFSTVSKSRGSMISNPLFARKHKNRAALLRRHRLVVYANSVHHKAASYCSLAPISSDLRLKVNMKQRRDDDGGFSDPFFRVISASNIDDARDFVFEGKQIFEGKPLLRGFCEELWCVEVNNALFLWNPSMRNAVELPPHSWFKLSHAYLYGVVYDSVNDDYKILQIRMQRRRPYTSTVLYSLRNNCWREIKPFSSDVKPSNYQCRCEFVEGKLHWVVITAARAPIIVSFDLSTEKYGEVAQPPYDAELGYKDELEVVALRGMLCASLNYTRRSRYVLWVMEEYGVEKSWTKRFDIPLSSRLPNLSPVHLFDSNDMILVKSYKNSGDYMCMFIFRNGEAKPKKIVVCGNHSISLYAEAFLHVESLITHEFFS